MNFLCFDIFSKTSDYKVSYELSVVALMCMMLIGKCKLRISGRSPLMIATHMKSPLWLIYINIKTL